MSTGSAIEWTDAKTCSRCGVAKPRDAFDADRSRADGLTYWCSECRRDRARAKYVKKGPPPSRRGRLYAETRDGDKRQARRRVNHLVDTGRLQRPSDLPCTDCGARHEPGKPRHEYDHHRGYGAAHQLDVEAVCQPCHREREAARRG